MRSLSSLSFSLLLSSSLFRCLPFIVYSPLSSFPPPSSHSFITSFSPLFCFLLSNQIIGGLHHGQDWLGDARAFTRQLADACATQGVVFRFDTPVLAVMTDGMCVGRIGESEMMKKRKMKRKKRNVRKRKESILIFISIHCSTHSVMGSYLSFFTSFPLFLSFFSLSFLPLFFLLQPSHGGAD